MQMANGSFACCVFIGELWCITKLKPWPLEQVLVQKYDYPLKQAKALKDFLVLLLTLDLSCSTSEGVWVQIAQSVALEKLVDDGEEARCTSSVLRLPWSH